MTAMGPGQHRMRLAELGRIGYRVSSLIIETVALGVLLDTIVVRSVLVTALNLDLGRWVWWPSKLAREPATEADVTVEPAAVGG
jgi:putative drug exporter of the RND superfamily